METQDLILKQLQDFALGKYIVANGSLDGYWTRYCVVEHPKNRGRKDISELESFLLDQAPTMLATQERFTIFQAQLQKRLHDNMALASIPCGYMDDLLALDYRGLSGITITGCDIDPKSCTGASENARQYKIQYPVKTHCMDAWNVGEELSDTFDLITSNGLNIYVPEADREMGLYQNFADALKKDGWLITSFLTPPPQVRPDSLWINVDADAFERQKMIFSDVLGVKWQNYNMPDEIQEKLTAVGFENIEIHYDRQRMFPTISAQKGG